MATKEEKMGGGGGDKFTDQQQKKKQLNCAPDVCVLLFWYGVYTVAELFSTPVTTWVDNVLTLIWLAQSTGIIYYLIWPTQLTGIIYSPWYDLHSQQE